MTKQLVTRKELRAIGVPYSYMHILRMEKAGTFPNRVKLSPNRVAWVLQEIEDWIQKRINSRG